MTDKELFYQRIDDEYDDFLQEVEDYGSEEVMNEAENIADMKRVYDYLTREKPIDGDSLKHFIKLKSPLCTICRQYQKDNPLTDDILNRTLCNIEKNNILDYATNKESEKLKEYMLKEYAANREQYDAQSKTYAAQTLAEKIFKVDYCFDEYDAKVLMQFKTPFSVLLDNIEMKRGSFKEDMEDTMFKIGGIDILTCKYAIDKNALLPETKFRHDIINKIIELVPEPNFETTAIWLDFFRDLRMNADEDVNLINNPYEQFGEALETISHRYGDEIIQQIYGLGKDYDLMLENELVGAADYLSNGGDISEVPAMAKDGAFFDWSISDEQGGMDIC